MDPLITVVIPVYNEHDHVLALLEKVRATPFRKQIILVDDCCTDGTTDLLKKEEANSDDLTLIFHEKNQGKGAALRTGFQHVKGDYVIIQDADLEYDPAEYGTLLEPLLDGRADVVYGSRFLAGPHRVHLFWHYMGNKFLTLLSNMLTNINLTDMETCYKVFRSDVLEKLDLKSNRFGFEPEFTIKVARLRLRIYETSISYSGRNYNEGKKITWRDGLAALYFLFLYTFIRR